MDQKMFCYQCEQTAKGTGCEGSTGVCGKTAEIAGIQDEVTGALIGLAQLAIKTAKEEQAYETIVEGLFTTLTNVNFDADALDEVLPLRRRCLRRI